MLIAQISDTHVASAGQKTFGIAPMAENLTRCVAHINALEPTPDLVLVTGDIANLGLAEELERAALILKSLHVPYYVIPGNHDSRESLRAAFDEKRCPSQSDKFIQYVVEDHPIRLIAIDTVHPGQPGGQFCAERAQWLDQRLAENRSQPTVIFMHHPPLKLGVLETDEDGFEGAEHLTKIIDKYTHIKRILSGHVHLITHTPWHGTFFSTAPSIGMTLKLDLTLQLPSAFHLDQPSYQLHYWTPEQNLVTFTV
ncbi:MAG: phosphodiesterase, partial [Gammaproteobacteria bacterium]|nr:phosphodiesterase [Gammaproteobacteria bacterium]